MGGRFGGCTGQERRIDIRLGLIGQFDRRRQAVAKRRMGTFHDDRQARIAKIRRQPPEQLSIQEDGESDQGRGQHHPACPPGRLHTPVERERPPKETHGREDEPRQRFQPDPAAGLPAQRREQRSQRRYVGGGLPAFGSRDRRRWIDDERHDKFSEKSETMQEVGVEELGWRNDRMVRRVSRAAAESIRSRAARCPAPTGCR